MSRFFTQICAVAVLFVISLIVVVGTCVVFEHVAVNYYKKPIDFGIGAVVVLFVASMVCIFLGRKRDVIPSTPYSRRDTITFVAEETEEGEDDEWTN